MSPADAAHFMAQALRLAGRGRWSTQPNPRVGCVIVRGGEIVGEGAHLRAGEPHAEVHALRMAGERARGADLFVTLEPCSHQGRTPPCADAVIAAGPRKVWVAMRDPNPQVAGRGLDALRAAGIAVEVGLLEGEAQRLNRGFVSRMTRQRPWLTLKLAASLDARTAMASGESQWISGAAARADVHRLRADAGSVMSSAATVLADDPQLTVRLPASGDADGDTGHDATMIARQPDRIVLDASAQVPLTAKVWRDGARRYWLVGCAPKIVPNGVEVIRCACDENGHLRLPDALSALAARGVNEILLECGPQLAGAVLAQQLADEIVVYVAPMLLGHEARPLALLPGLERLTQHIALEFIDTRRVGKDLRISLRPVRRAES